MHDSGVATDGLGATKQPEQLMQQLKKGKQKQEARIKSRAILFRHMLALVVVLTDMLDLPKPKKAVQQAGQGVGQGPQRLGRIFIRGLLVRGFLFGAYLVYVWLVSSDGSDPVKGFWRAIRYVGPAYLHQLFNSLFGYFAAIAIIAVIGRMAKVFRK